MEEDDYTPTTADVSALEQETSAPVIPLSDLIGSFEDMSTSPGSAPPAPKAPADKPVDDLLDLLSAPAPSRPAPAAAADQGVNHAAVGGGLDLLDFGPPPGANRGGVASMPMGGGGGGGFGGNLASMQPIKQGNPFSSDLLGGDLLGNSPGT